MFKFLKLISILSIFKMVKSLMDLEGIYRSFINKVLLTVISSRCCCCHSNYRSNPQNRNVKEGRHLSWCFLVVQLSKISICNYFRLTSDFDFLGWLHLGSQRLVARLNSQMLPLILWMNLSDLLTTWLVWDQNWNEFLWILL